MCVRIIVDNKVECYVIFISTRYIRKGEELVTNYEGEIFWLYVFVYFNN